MVPNDLINRFIFQASIEQAIVPMLRRGDTVIINDLPARKSAKVSRPAGAVHTTDELWDAIRDARLCVHIRLRGIGKSLPPISNDYPERRYR